MTTTTDRRKGGVLNGLLASFVMAAMIAFVAGFQTAQVESTLLVQEKP